MPRLEESDSGHNLHSSRSHGYRQPLSPGRFQVESHRAPPVQPNQQKLGWRTPHRHRQDPQVHPYHQNGIRPYRQCVSHPRELRHRNQDLRRGNASTQPRSPRNARALELYRTPHSECELILGHRLSRDPIMTARPLILLLAAPLFAQDAALAPAVLPGNGLAQHDFFYAGEQKQHQMFIVKKGQIAWSYIDATSKGEISDAVLLANGNILFAHQFGVTLITPDKKLLWSYDAPAGAEVHTAQPIGTKHVVFIQNGDPAILRVVNIATNQTVREFPLPTGNPKSVHGHFLSLIHISEPTR